MNLELSNSLSKQLKVCALILCGLLVVACDTSPSTEQEYLTRLSNVLDVNINQDVEVMPFPKFPQQRNLQIQVERGELSIREFLSLRECALHTTIAHRNSLLGKVSSASQLLFSDIRILDQGPECLALLDGNLLGQKLEQFLKLKRSQIGQTLWSTLLAQNEHRQFWRAKSDQSAYPTTIGIDVTDSISALAEFSQQVIDGKTDYSDDDFKQIEWHLGQQRFGDGGQLLKQYLEQINTLKKANYIIAYRLKRPLCFEQKATNKARYFDNVVRRFFIAKVQLNAVKLNQRADVLLTSHQQLETPLKAYANKHYQTWASNRDALIAKGKTSTTEHVKFIQQLYSQCNLIPGKA